MSGPGAKAKRARPLSAGGHPFRIDIPDPHWPTCATLGDRWPEAETAATGRSVSSRICETCAGTGWTPTTEGHRGAPQPPAAFRNEVDGLAPLIHMRSPGPRAAARAQPRLAGLHHRVPQGARPAGRSGRPRRRPRRCLPRGVPVAARLRLQRPAGPAGLERRADRPGVDGADGAARLRALRRRRQRLGHQHLDQHRATR